jgi:hypothetical protein
MNTATNAPTQGEKPSWQLICVVDALDELNADHAFLTALYELTASNPQSMGDDQRRLLTATWTQTHGKSSKSYLIRS